MITYKQIIAAVGQEGRTMTLAVVWCKEDIANDDDEFELFLTPFI